MAVKPDSQKDMLTQIWFAMYGTNGADGVVSRVEKLEGRPRSRALLIKDILLVAMPILFFLLGTGVLGL